MQLRAAVVERSVSIGSNVLMWGRCGRLGSCGGNRWRLYGGSGWRCRDWLVNRLLSWRLLRSFQVWYMPLPGSLPSRQCCDGRSMLLQRVRGGLTDDPLLSWQLRLHRSLLLHCVEASRCNAAVLVRRKLPAHGSQQLHRLHGRGGPLEKSRHPVESGC